MKKALFIQIAFAALMLCACGGGKQPSVQGFDDIVASRRSVRDYDASKSISREEVMELIKCAQEAPSWANQQPSKYYVAMSPEKVAAVKELVGPSIRSPTKLYVE